MNLKYIFRVLVLFLLGFLLVKICLKVHENNSFGCIKQGKVHGTYYNIKFKQTLLKDDIDDLDELFHRFDLSLSTFNDSSIISRINRNEEVKVDSFFASVFNTAEEISKNTGGAFDMTVAPLVNAWGFGFKHNENVDKNFIDSILNFVGYEKVKLENGYIKKEDSRIMLDASAIAKGYSCDVVANYMIENGFEDFLVEIGGEIVAKGKNYNGEKWSVGIEKPIDDSTMKNNGLQTIVYLQDMALATSGNYRQFYYKDGKKFSHTINPKTGYPVEHNLLSVSVIAKDCKTADAYATAFMVLGVEKSLKVLEHTPGVEAYFISSGENGAFEIDLSEGFKNYLKE